MIDGRVGSLNVHSHRVELKQIVTDESCGWSVSENRCSTVAYESIVDYPRGRVGECNTDIIPDEYIVADLYKAPF